MLTDINESNTETTPDTTTQTSIEITLQTSDIETTEPTYTTLLSHSLGAIRALFSKFYNHARTGRNERNE